MPPTVVALFRTPAKREPMIPVGRLDLVEETGAANDRHARRGSRRQLLLMDAESLGHFALEPGRVREQVTTRGLDLYRLVFGARLRVGSAVLEVAAPCAPCERMNEIAPGLREAIRGRRGRFVRVVSAGAIAVGDAILAEPGALPGAGGAAGGPPARSAGAE